MPTDNENISVVTTPMPGTPGGGLPEGDEASKAALAADEASKVAAASKTDEEVAADAAAAKAAAAEKAPTELTLDSPTIEVDETGHADFDVVGKMLADKGVANANDIMDDFMETGEISLEHKATMIEALGEGVASMAFKQMEGTADDMIAEAKEESAATMNYAKEKFGGEDAETIWKEIQVYVRTPEAGFSEADLASMSAMIAEGGLQAKLVIDKVHAVYKADPNVSHPGTLLEGDSAVNGITFEPISRAEYTAAMGKAVNEYGEDSYQVRELDRRRTLSMRKNI